MSTSSNLDADSVNGRLADFLYARKEEIVRAWMARVQADHALPAESLTANQLRDHLPHLIDDLVDILRRYGTEDTTRRLIRDAEKHGAERWQQGYDPPQLLREVMHLRAVFIYHLRVFEETYAEFGTAARLFAHTTVHQFLDELAIDATERFLELERRARRDVLGLS